MYTTRPLFTRRPVANYREIIKSRLKHWRKLANMSQAQAAKLAGVARSTWQTWEDPARGALPDLAALAAVADGCRIEGHVENSILFRDVEIAKGAVVKDCIIMEGGRVLSEASLKHVVTDRNVVIRNGRTMMGHENYPITIAKNSTI